jgi:hypothetical protein
VAPSRGYGSESADSENANIVFISWATERFWKSLIAVHLISEYESTADQSTIYLRT